MQAAISQADATVVASVFALIGVVYAAWRANRREHAANTDRLDRGNAKLDQLLENQDNIRKDVVFIRADVQDIRGQITELRASDHETDARVTKLERHRPEGNDAA